jgi:hypothetical protein
MKLSGFSKKPRFGSGSGFNKFGFETVHTLKYIHDGFINLRRFLTNGSDNPVIRIRSVTYQRVPASERWKQ